MELDIKTSLRNACQTLLRPIASVLMKSGMTWKEFSDLSKTVFVSVASDEFGIRGRPTNVSRVSILTGISRKEIKRQRDLIETEAPPSSSKTTDATRLLSGWHQDRLYTNSQDEPLPLAKQGTAPSFQSLFEVYGGDTPEQTLTRELLAANSIEPDSDGRYVATRRYHMPANMDVGNIHFLGSNLHDHAQTLSNNLSDDGSPKRLEGFAVDDRIDPEAVDKFREFIDQKGEQFLEDVDEWLNRHRFDATDSKKTSPVRLGLGIYAIQGDLPKGTLK